MTKKTVRFNGGGIGKVAINKPIIYNIVTEGGKTHYIGVAKRGRAQERLQEHLPGGKDPIPGAKVKIEQRSIREAQAKETRLIAQNQPPHNEKGK